MSSRYGELAILVTEARCTCISRMRCIVAVLGFYRVLQVGWQSAKMLIKGYTTYDLAYTIELCSFWSPPTRKTLSPIGGTLGVPNNLQYIAVHSGKAVFIALYLSRYQVTSSTCIRSHTVTQVYCS